MPNEGMQYGNGKLEAGSVSNRSLLKIVVLDNFQAVDRCYGTITTAPCIAINLLLQNGHRTMKFKARNRQWFFKPSLA